MAAFISSLRTEEMVLRRSSSDFRLRKTWSIAWGFKRSLALLEFSVIKTSNTESKKVFRS